MHVTQGEEDIEDIFHKHNSSSASELFLSCVKTKREVQVRI